VGPYNGYSAQERTAKFVAYKRLVARGSLPEPYPPCQACGDQHAGVGPHSEDYSLPYRWSPPAEYWVCTPCHGWIHRRFSNPYGWLAFKEHLRMGGHGKDFRAPPADVRHQLLLRFHAHKEPQGIGTYISNEARRPLAWWDVLTLDRASLTSSWARPRP
jgi:hypothetical protein